MDFEEIARVAEQAAKSSDKSRAGEDSLTLSQPMQTTREVLLEARDEPDCVMRLSGIMSDPPSVQVSAASKTVPDILAGWRATDQARIKAKRDLVSLTR
jgi:hypothetical protein